jgi:hypothetical protein
LRVVAGALPLEQTAEGRPKGVGPLVIPNGSIVINYVLVSLLFFINPEKSLDRLGDRSKAR